VIASRLARKISPALRTAEKTHVLDDEKVSVDFAI
jgi:hypothetical protein